MKISLPGLTRGRAFGLALAAVAVTAVAVTVVAVTGVPGAGASSAEPSKPEKLPTECSTERKADCRQIALPDGTSVRYTVLNPDASAHSRNAVVVDLGGPGLSLFGRHWPQDLRSNLGEDLSAESLILLEEPWVTAMEDESCRTSAATWFTAIHESQQGTSADRLAQDCSLGQGRYGWTQQRYAQAVAAIATQGELKVEGMIGVSFGARRSLYLEAAPAWTVLVNPAPRKMSATDYLDARRDGAFKLLAQTCGCSSSEAASRLARVQSEYAAEPQKVSRRSVSVTAADLGAAVLALPYQSESVRAQGASALLGETEDAPIIGALADTVWNRVGTNDVSLAALAYLDEVCLAYPGWAAVPKAKDAVQQALNSLHSPCANVPATASSISGTTDQGASTRCVAFREDDAIAPPEFAETWRGTGPYLGSKGSQHTDITAIKDCLESLRKGKQQ